MKRIVSILLIISMVFSFGFIASERTPFATEKVDAATHTIKIIQIDSSKSQPLETYFYVGEQMDWDVLWDGAVYRGKYSSGFRWSSSNTGVVSFPGAATSCEGTMKAVAKGTAKITVKDVNFTTIYSAAAYVKVKQAAKSVSLSKTTEAIDMGLSKKLTATINPSATDDKANGVKWTSSNTKVAKVDSSGNLTGVGAGTAIISATFTNLRRPPATAIKGSFIGSTVPATVVGKCTVTVSPRVRTATFNVNGGKELATTSKTKKVTYTLAYGALPLPTRNQYAFTGWFTSASGGSKITEATKVTSLNDHTLYAQWKHEAQLVDANKDGKDDSTGAVVPWAGFNGKNGEKIPSGWNGKIGTRPKYTVAFNVNGGTEIAIKSKQVGYGMSYGSLPIPTKKYYANTGWFTSAKGGTKITSVNKLTGSTKNHTLYAQWKPQAQLIDANKDGKDDSTGAVVPWAGFIGKNGEKIPKSWNGKLGKRPQFTVKLNVNGGKKISTKSKQVKYGMTYGTLPTPSKKHYTFTGWFTRAKKGKMINSDTKLFAFKSHSLYAHWKAKQYVITFSTNGGQNLTKTVTYGKRYGKLPKGTNIGYRFLGWYTKKKDGKKITSKSIVKISKNRTLYPHWKKK